MDDLNERQIRRGPAFGGPGVEPRWNRAQKEAIGTSRSAASHVWFTVSQGVVEEVYWPTIDSPQIRDLQFLFTDGATFFHGERELHTAIEPLTTDTLGFQVTNLDPQGRFRIVKQIIADPDQSVILIRSQIEVADSLRETMRVFLLFAPHLDRRGWGNSGWISSLGDRRVLIANSDDSWVALGASVPLTRGSVGYVGVSDGWQDLSSHLDMSWEFDQATDGNIALTAELDLSADSEFTVGLAFSDRRHGAVTALLQGLGHSFDALAGRFIAEWSVATASLMPLEKESGDDGSLYRMSRALLLAHEDKLYPGALIAALSIPWGDAKSDADLGGYHLVWSRDLVNSATGLLAAGNNDIPLHALIYLAASQLPDGGFHQNFWVTGEPYWTGIQLDEVAFPILLAWRLHMAGALAHFDPYDMVVRAAGYLVRHGPATPQDRWEEVGGYSPSTLASNIAALTCASSWCKERGDLVTSSFLREYADFLECHIERWTVTRQGTLHPDIKRHFVRINPAGVDQDEDPDRAVVPIANKGPGERQQFPASEIVDAGFLELVRYGVRRFDDPLVVDSLKVVDDIIRGAPSLGPVWHRYNHDGYGQRSDGGPFDGWGVGRPWPLLTGERGHYELAAGRDIKPYISAMESFAHGVGLLPEQVWDEPDRPEHLLRFGSPTGAAIPLMWAHAEYIKLLRSAYDGRVYDFIPEVADRYWKRRDSMLEIWKPNRQARSVGRGDTLRIQAPGTFHLVWSGDDWQNVAEAAATPTKVGVEYVDIPIAASQKAPIRFTFRWEDDRWEGKDYRVDVI